MELDCRHHYVHSGQSKVSVRVGQVKRRMMDVKRSSDILLCISMACT